MNKLIISILCWLLIGIGLWAEPTSNAKGVMLLTSASGLDPRNVLFTDQVWTSFDGGTVIDTDGQKTVFAKKDIGKIIYFDSHYYGQMDNDPQERAYREGIQAREEVINTCFLNLEAATDQKKLQDNESLLESLNHEYPAIQPLVQPQIDQLKDDMSKLSGGQSLLNGKWMSQVEANAQAPPTIGGGAQTVTFTAKDGKKYENAKVTVTDSGLSVLTADGGTTITFDNLPDDLSVFSVSVRKLITDKHQAAMVPASNPTPSTLEASNQTTSTSSQPSVPPDSIAPLGISQEDCLLTLITTYNSSGIDRITLTTYGDPALKLKYMEFYGSGLFITFRFLDDKAVDISCCSGNKPYGRNGYTGDLSLSEAKAFLRIWHKTITGDGIDKWIENPNVQPTYERPVYWWPTPNQEPSDPNIIIQLSDHNDTPDVESLHIVSYHLLRIFAPKVGQVGYVEGKMSTTTLYPQN